MKTRNVISLSMLVAFFLGISVSANAALYYELNIMTDEHHAGGYDDVVLTQEASGVMFTLTSINSHWDNLYFNLNSLKSVENIEVISKGNWEVTTNKTASNFGRFDYLIQGRGNPSANDPLQFYIKGISLPDRGLLTANDEGWFFVGHLHENPNTFVGSNNMVTNPIPGAVWLLGSGLVGLVVIRRRVSK